MNRKLEETLDQLYEIEGVEACLLYRIDGVPITIRVPGFREHLLETMFWLEKHIRHVLGENEPRRSAGNHFLFQE